MIRTFLLFACIITHSFIFAQINPENIEIVRDSFGIPHIFAKTNAEAAYGVAWAQCEDNYPVMQEAFAAARGRAGVLLGVDGAAIDYILQMFQIREFVAERYDKDVSPEYDAMLEAYVQAVNRYVELHPEEQRIKGMDNITKQEALQIYLLNFLVNNHTVMDIAKVLQNQMELYETLGRLQGAGSNAMAYSPRKTTDGKTYLVANPHQPIDGPASFWEVGITTEEGLNVYGATFVGGGITPFIGSNRNLGWTHTTNYDDYSDVFKLTMHPHKKGLYRFDGEWLELEKHVAKFKVKIGPIILPIRKKYYTSIYGPTAKNKDGFYAFRNNAFFNIRTAEQWYRMALAENMEEFWAAIEMQGIPTQTITYADKEGNIFHHNNASIPVRNPAYEWLDIVPGDTSATLWSYDKIMPARSNPHVINPQAGYVFDSNSTPLDCTAPDENPNAKDYPATYGLTTSNTLRSKRYKELIEQHDKVSFEDIKAMRDDVSYHSTNLNFRNAMNLNDMPDIIGRQKDLQDVKAVMDKWDRRMNIENEQATIIILISMHISNFLFKNFALYDNVLPEETYIEGARFAKKFLLKHYGTLEVPLGEVQKIVRGDIEMPMYGSPQTLANCHVKKYKKGKVKMKHGDTFIMYAQYGEEGLESFKTVNLFGNSWKPESPHYADQMELLVNKKVKNIELNKELIYKKAIKRYHPK